MSKKIVHFIGIPSGDNEAFCWDVTKEEFKRLTGKNPSKHDKSFFNKKHYRIYPGREIPDIVDDNLDGQATKTSLYVTMTEARIKNKRKLIVETSVLPDPEMEKECLAAYQKGNYLTTDEFLVELRKKIKSK